MARFDIISKDGKTIRYSGKPRYCGSYLKPSFLEFSEMAYPTPIAWEVGDYVDYPRTGMRYRLYSIPQASKNARKGSYGGAFTYSNVQFHAATKELEIALFRDLVANDNNIHFSTSPDVATYENVEGIARRIQACMDDLYPGRWEIRMAEFDAVADAEVIEKIATAKDFALSGGTCLDALSKIYELWEDIGWIHTYENGKEVITIGYANRRVDANTTDAYLYGKGNGLTAIKKNQTNKDEFATRLYVYGSERNLPHRYYNGKDILNAESVDIRNLMLPLDKWGLTDGLPDAHKAYLENAEAVAKYGVIPKIHYFDSDDAGADIYPSIEGMTVGQLRKVLADMGETKYSPNASIYPNDSERVDEVWGSPRVMDDGILKRNGKEHDFDIGWYLFATTTPGTTIPKGTAEKTAVVENRLIKDLDIDSQGIIRAKITFTSDKICTLADAGYESVSGVLTLANSLDSPSIEEEMGFTFVLNDDGVWEGRLPKVIANYDNASYARYMAFASLSVYVTPKNALASDVTASVNISDGYVTFIADQLFDKTFQLTLKQIGFDINERAAMGEGKVISMKTGMCAGRNFVISECRYVKNVDRWVLTCRRQQDDTLGMLFPNKDYQIATDDQFVLLDIALPEVYIGVAQERLLAEGERLLAKASKIQSHYEPMIDAKVMIESGRTLREGMFMEISDEDVIDNGTDYILIDTLSIYEDESAIPTYKVTLREKRKVTYKGTPSATSETSTKSYGEDQAVNADIDLSDYATKDYVDNAIGSITPGGGGSSVDIEGSEFVKVSSSGKISLKIDSQGGLGNTGQGMGIVEIPELLLSEYAKKSDLENLSTEDEVYVVYYYNGLSEEHKAENKKAYDAIMAGSDSCYVITDKTSSTKIIATAALKSSTIAGLMAYQMMPTSKDEITIGILSLSLYEDGSTKQTTTQSYVLNREAVNALLSGKQDVLVSGKTIKTINGQDILGEGDLIIQGGSGGAEVRTLFVNDAGLSADELSYNADTYQQIFAQKPMIFYGSAEEGTPILEYELMGMDNGRMVFARYELNEYSTGATYIYLAMDGSTEVGGFSKSELDGDKYDSSLDADSVNAVQNKVVTENIRALEAAMPLMAVIDLDTIIAQDTPIDNATRNALLELGGYTSGDKYFSKGWIWSRGYLYTIKVIPTDAGVQIHVLSLKGWTEIAEDNSKVNHLPSQGGGSIEVDAELSETSENAVSNKAVTMAIVEDEEVTAAALVELNERVNESATKKELEDALADVSIEVDSAMSDTSENAVSNKTIKKYVDDADKSVKEYVDDADNALSERISALEQNSGGGNVKVDAELSESSTNAIANKAVTEAIIEDEEVAAAALVDLDKRLKDIVKILKNAGLM